jgi:hypothetical protein
MNSVRQYSNVPAYLDSIAAIPVISKERIESHMEVMVVLAKMLVAGWSKQVALARDNGSHPPVLETDIN